MNRSQKPSSSSASVSRSQDPGFKDSWSYETAVAEIESVVMQIESGDLELAEVFDQFAIAMNQLQRCEAFLNQHQQQFNLILETLVNDPVGDPEEDEEDF